MTKRPYSIIMVLVIAIMLSVSLSAAKVEKFYVNTVASFLTVLGPNRIIYLDNGDYDLTGFSNEFYNPYLRVVNGEITVINSDNLRIYGTNNKKTHVFTPIDSVNVLSFDNCRNIEIENIRFGHQPAKGDCTGDVLVFQNSSNIALDKVIMYGSGIVGIKTLNVSNLECKNSTITECSWQFMSLESSHKLTFSKCSFVKNISGNGVNIVNSNEILIQKCTFSENTLSKGTEHVMFAFAGNSSLNLVGNKIINNVFDNFSNIPAFITQKNNVQKDNKTTGAVD